MPCHQIVEPLHMKLEKLLSSLRITSYRSCKGHLKESVLYVNTLIKEGHGKFLLNLFLTISLVFG